MFNFHRAMLLAGMRFGLPEALAFMRLMAPPAAPLGVSSKYRSSAPGGHDRLYLDRSSSVKKLQRWLRNGDIPPPPPVTETEKMRHHWYRRQKEREARIAATEAWNSK